MLSKEDLKLVARTLGGNVAHYFKTWSHVNVSANDLSALLAAARDEGRAEGLGGWEPIETAPNNTDHMRPILAFWKHRGVQQTYWDVDEEYSDRPKGWRSLECGWRCDGDQCIPVNQEDATHWRPLPAPPASQAQEG